MKHWSPASGASSCFASPSVPSRAGRRDGCHQLPSHPRNPEIRWKDLSLILQKCHVGAVKTMILVLVNTIKAKIAKSLEVSNLEVYLVKLKPT